MSGDNFNFCVNPAYSPFRLRDLSEAKWPLAQLRERYANRRMCQRCRTILRRAGKVRRVEPWKAIESFRKSVSKASDLFEKTLGKDCNLCLLFLSTLSEKERETMRRQKNEWHESVRAAHDNEVGGFHIDIMAHLRAPRFLHLEFQYEPPSNYESQPKYSIVEPRLDDGLNGYAIFKTLSLVDPNGCATFILTSPELKLMTNRILFS